MIWKMMINNEWVNDSQRIIEKPTSENKKHYEQKFAIIQESSHNTNNKFQTIKFSFLIL